MNKLQMRRYAKLLAKTGVNVKRGQWVIVQTELDQPEFVEMVVEELYRAGGGQSERGIYAPTFDAAPL